MTTSVEKNASGINDFLLANKLLIRDNPAVSPDLTLDFDALFNEISAESGMLQTVTDTASAEKASRNLRALILWPKSMFLIGKDEFFVIESAATGDAALFTRSAALPTFKDVKKTADGISVIPLTWQNLIGLKNAVLEKDPGSTIFPRADAGLKKTSLGIGARFTTLHWPAVAWAMKALNLPVTANQNSIPRELVYDVGALLAGKLEKVPFPFIGASVPEGHQGQSVQGMSHASVVTYLKYGFHRNRIPWGFNADHQPIGGRFDAIEKELAEGSLFASYITYDLSPELSSCKLIDDERALEEAFRASVDPNLFATVVERLGKLGIRAPEAQVKKMVVYLMPAMKKMVRRHEWYRSVRDKTFTTDTGRAFARELSIDELPGETAPATLAISLAMAEAMGVTFDFIAPNIGFQKNIPYPDNAGLETKIAALYDVARLFGVSIGFHSGSGKSADNYRIMSARTDKSFEVKTSGRYTYEMGVALSRSAEAGDRALWTDWYNFTKALVVRGAFSAYETQRSFARDFIGATLKREGVSTAGAFESPQALSKLLDSLTPSPDHHFWFEYNFLFVLAAGGSIDRLGDHSAEGYRQRARFYAISDQAKLLFAKGVAGYILFLAESTGIATPQTTESAKKRLAEYSNYEELLGAIGPN